MKKHLLLIMAAAALVSIQSCKPSYTGSGDVPVDENTSLRRGEKEDLFHVGMAGYTFKNFSVDQTIEFMEKLGVQYLCIKDFHLPLDSNADSIAAFHKKLADHGVKGYAVGPIYMNDEAQVDKAFDYAQRVGVDMVVGVPDYELLDYVEEKVKSTGIRLAIHLHGASYKYYHDAAEIWDKVKDRDPRMGMCLDTGHNLRYGSDTIKDLYRFRSRVFDIHLKDVTGPTWDDGAKEVGRGVIDWKKFVKVLRKMGYSGSISLEFEKDMEDPFCGISESIGYFRGVCESTR